MQDADGKIDEKELHICLLLIYDKLNSKLPCRVIPPTSMKVKELFLRHDVDKTGALAENEILAVAKDLFANDKHWADSILVKVAIVATIQLACFPLAGTFALALLSQRISL